MADTPTPPPPPTDTLKPRARRTPPRHADAAKPTRSRGGAAAKRGAPAKRATPTKRAPAKRKAAAAKATPAPAPAPRPDAPAPAGGALRWASIAGAALAAIGAIGGLLALRGSTPRADTAKASKGKGKNKKAPPSEDTKSRDA